MVTDKTIAELVKTTEQHYEVSSANTGGWSSAWTIEALALASRTRIWYVHEKHIALNLFLM